MVNTELGSLGVRSWLLVVWERRLSNFAKMYIGCLPTNREFFIDVRSLTAGYSSFQGIGGKYDEHLFLK